MCTEGPDATFGGKFEVIFGAIAIGMLLVVSVSFAVCTVAESAYTPAGRSLGGWLGSGGGGLGRLNWNDVSPTFGGLRLMLCGTFCNPVLCNAVLNRTLLAPLS